MSVISTTFKYQGSDPLATAVNLFNQTGYFQFKIEDIGASSTVIAYFYGGSKRTGTLGELYNTYGTSFNCTITKTADNTFDIECDSTGTVYTLTFSIDDNVPTTIVVSSGTAHTGNVKITQSRLEKRLY